MLPWMPTTMSHAHERRRSINEGKQRSDTLIDDARKRAESLMDDAQRIMSEARTKAGTESKHS